MGLTASIVIWTIRLLTLSLVVLTVMPMLRTGWWFVRMSDFPRLQLAGIAGAALLALVVFTFLTETRRETWVLGVMLVLVAGWQLWRVAPYTPVWPKAAPDAEHHQLRLLISNLDKRNDRRAEVAAMIDRVDPDVLLLIEIGEAWAEGLDEVRGRFNHRLEAIREDGLGLALWSKLPMTDPHVRHLVSERRPSMIADLHLEDGQALRFVGIHPTPPGLPVDGDGDRYDSRIRDAELMKVGYETADDPNRPWIVAGDFNDVAWSHTTTMFEEVSGLLDPRKGRKLLNTYHAERPLLRYPLDHIFVSPGFRIGRFERVRAPGSDHFAVLAELELHREHAEADPKKGEEIHDHLQDLVEDGVEDAAERDERSGIERSMA